MRRPFVKLYKEFKWLNAFAIITDVAAQELMKDFDSLFFLEKDSQILKENIEMLINETRMKKDHQLLYGISQDIVETYSNLFTDGNKAKAQKELDARKSISLQNAVVLSFFGGGSMT
jgi:hypothetical protein